MNDKGIIFTGVVVFLLIVAFPIWYNVGKAAPLPQVEYTDKAKAAGACVYEKEYMKREHMQVLDDWRHDVVRNGNRVFVNEKGKEFNMSLSNTCLDCHSNKDKFCDRCHTYASVDPYCWDCHIDNPKETKK